MSSGTGNYFMNIPKGGESGGQILPTNTPTGTGTSGTNYESAGTTAPFPPYNFSFFGGKRKKRTKKTKKRHKVRKTRKSRKSRKSRK